MCVLVLSSNIKMGITCSNTHKVYFLPIFNHHSIFANLKAALEQTLAEWNKQKLRGIWRKDF